MTLDSFSEIILILACAWIAWRTFKQTDAYAGIGLAALIIGFAAFLGMVRFSSFADASALIKGPHQFASIVASVSAFPILAFSLARPKSPIAMRIAGAWWMTFVAAGFGVALVALGFKLWAQTVPAVCALWIGYSVIFTKAGRSLPRILGFLSLLLSFAATLLIKPDILIFGIFSKTQLLHYFLAIALVLLALRECQSSKSSNLKVN